MKPYNGRMQQRPGYQDSGKIDRMHLYYGVKVGIHLFLRDCALVMLSVSIARGCFARLLREWLCQWGGEGTWQEGWEIQVLIKLCPKTKFYKYQLE